MMALSHRESLPDAVADVYAAFAADYLWNHVDVWFEEQMTRLESALKARGKATDKLAEQYQNDLDKMEDLHGSLEHAVSEYGDGLTQDMLQALTSGDPNLVLEALSDGTVLLDID